MPSQSPRKRFVNILLTSSFRATPGNRSRHAHMQYNMPHDLMFGMHSVPLPAAQRPSPHPSLLLTRFPPGLRPGAESSRKRQVERQVAGTIQRASSSLRAGSMPLANFR